MPKIAELQKLWPSDYHEILNHVSFTGFQKILWVEVERLREELSLSTEQLLNVGKALFIHSTSVQYYGELCSEDVIEISLKILKKTKVKLKLSGEIFKAGTRVCAAVFTLACIDTQTGKLTTIPE